MVNTKFKRTNWGTEEIKEEIKTKKEAWKKIRKQEYHRICRVVARNQAKKIRKKLKLKPNLYQITREMIHKYSPIISLIRLFFHKECTSKSFKQRKRKMPISKKKSIVEGMQIQ